jgi:hypothetical protein
MIVVWTEEKEGKKQARTRWSSRVGIRHCVQTTSTGTGSTTIRSTSSVYAFLEYQYTPANGIPTTPYRR